MQIFFHESLSVKTACPRPKPHREVYNQERLRLHELGLSHSKKVAPFSTRLAVLNNEHGSEIRTPGNGRAKATGCLQRARRGSGPTYAENAQQFEFPSTLLATGSAEIRARFKTRFQEPNLHADVRQRIVMGNIVVDYERVTRTFAEGAGAVELIAIYEVEAGHIAKATFIPGTKTLED